VHISLSDICTLCVYLQGRQMSLGKDMGWEEDGLHEGDALWEDTLLKSEDWTECAQTHTQTDRQTKVKTVYPQSASFTPFIWRI